MIDINLLSTDQEVTATAPTLGSAFFGLAAGVAFVFVSLIAIFAYDSYLKNSLTSWQTRRDSAQARLNELLPLGISLATLKQKLQAISQIEKSRFDFAGSFNYVRQLLPAGVDLNRISLEDTQKISFTAHSQTSSPVVLLIQRVTTDQNLQKTHVSGLRLDDSGLFSLTVSALYGKSNPNSSTQ